MNHGDTFLITETGIDDHLWIVLSDPNQDTSVLIVNCTSFGGGKDATCVLDVGDHPWIKRKTCIAYGFMRRAKVGDLKRHLANSAIVLQASMTQPVMRRILDGAAVSRTIRAGYGEILTVQGLIKK